MGNTLVLEEAPVFEIIPEGTILSTVVEKAEVKDSFFWNDKEDHSKGKQQEVAFTFKVTEDGEYLDRKIFGRTSTAFTTHDNCKLRRWVEEIFAFIDLPVGFEFNTDNLQDQPVQVVVGLNKYTDKKGDPQERNFADNLIRVPADDEPF